MAPRKRKAPEKKGHKFLTALLSSTAFSLGYAGRGLGTLAWRYPRPAAGAALFAVIFGAIAANALWYQPHRVVSPFLVTRDAKKFDALPGWHTDADQTGDVTTYKIERAGNVVVEGEETATIPVASDPLTGVGSTRQTRQLSGQPENVAMAVAVQQGLIRRGLYDGAADGVIGPRTSAAILFFEQTAGLPQTGEVSETLLQALAADGGGVAASLPASNAGSGAQAGETDPVAAAILSAPPTPIQKPHRTAAAEASQARAEKPRTPQSPVVDVSASGDDLAALIRNSGGTSGGKNTVRQIQQGLIRMSYPGVAADGVAGPSTKSAIRQFEKYYGLPQTGEPSEFVLGKMREFGLVPKEG